MAAYHEIEAAQRGVLSDDLADFIDEAETAGYSEKARRRAAAAAAMYDVAGVTTKSEAGLIRMQRRLRKENAKRAVLGKTPWKESSFLRAAKKMGDEIRDRRKRRQYKQAEGRVRPEDLKREEAILEMNADASVPVKLRGVNEKTYRKYAFPINNFDDEDLDALHAPVTLPDGRVVEGFRVPIKLEDGSVYRAKIANKLTRAQLEKQADDDLGPLKYGYPDRKLVKAMMGYGRQHTMEGAGAGLQPWQSFAKPVQYDARESAPQTQATSYGPPTLYGRTTSLFGAEAAWPGTASREFVY